MLLSLLLDFGITNALTFSIILTCVIVYSLYCWDKKITLLAVLFLVYLSLLPIQSSGQNRYQLVNTILEKSFCQPPEITWHNDKPISKQSIFIFSPHGNLPLGMLWLLGTPPFTENTYLLVSKKLFHWWGSNLFCRFRGRILEISHENIRWCLQQGHSILMSLGGIQEMLLEHQQPNEIYLFTGHKRIFQYSQQYKVPVVPILCEGHQNLYNNPFKFMSRLMYRYCKYPLPLFFTNQRMFPISNRLPLKIYIWKRIHHCTSKKLYRSYEKMCKTYIPTYTIKLIS